MDSAGIAAMLFCGDSLDSGGDAFIEPPLNSRADMLHDLGKVWDLPGVETPVTPDGPDVLDGGDGVEGLVVDGVGLSANYLILITNWPFATHMIQIIDCSIIQKEHPPHLDAGSSTSALSRLRYQSVVTR
jgi:hypothetical protein